jgi:hypothetical protein
MAHVAFHAPKARIITGKPNLNALRPSFSVRQCGNCYVVTGDEWHQYSNEAYPPTPYSSKLTVILSRPGPIQQSG